MRTQLLAALCASPIVLAVAVSAQTPRQEANMMQAPETEANTMQAPDPAANTMQAPPEQAQPAAAAGTVMTATLAGAAEVPGPGDPDGGGSAEVRVDAARNQVCYTLTVTDIDTATAAHIHTGASGAAGPVAVPFEAPADGSSEGCATVAPALATALMQNPSGYYVNVHNAAFPNGAIRGQLGR